jgi:hypothetical protein
MLTTISVMNAFAYYSSETPKSNPPNGPDSNSARRKSGGSGLTFPSPAHRRLQGLTPRVRALTFCLVFNGNDSLAAPEIPSLSQPILWIHFNSSVQYQLSRVLPAEPELHKLE